MLLIDHHNDLRGASRSLLALLTHLDRSRFTPMLACRTGGSLSAVARQHGIFVHEVEIPTRDPFRRARQLWEAGQRISRVVRHAGVDLVHAHGAAAGFAASLALRRCRRDVPLVWHARDLDPEVQVFRAARQATLTLASFQRVAASLRPMVEAEVIHDGVPDAFFRDDLAARAGFRSGLGVPDGAPLVGIIARLETPADHDAAFSAVPLVAEQHPDAHFLFAGPETSQAAFSDAAREAQAFGPALAGGRVHYLAPQDIADVIAEVPALLHGLDLLVHPAVGPESTARVVVEAKACGVPAVASTVGVLPELIRDGVDGCLVAPRSPAQLADRICWLLRDTARREAMGRAAREDARARFSATRQAAAIGAAYDRALAMSRSKSGADGA